jgi:hypothetical protein
MYRRIAFAAAVLGLSAGGGLVVWALLRPYQDLQRSYGFLLGFAGLLVGGVELAGATSIPASAGHVTWRRLRPRWPVLMGVVVIAFITAGIGIAAAVAISSPDPQSGPQPAVPLRAPDSQPSDTLPQRPP